MKKIISISFLLVALIIFLAHIIIPHHHHESEIFVINPQSESECHAENIKNHNNPREKEEANYCSLNQFFIVSQKHLSSDADYYNFFSSCDFGDDLVDYYYFENKQNLPQVVIIPKPPLLSNSYVLLSIQSKGLRAPPSVFYS